jgi:CRISPR/Cas system-associated exonuclease Cas4 (RecB family)
MNDIPKPILDKMLSLSDRYGFDDKVFHVSELIYCLRKAYFRRRCFDKLKLNPLLRWFYFRGRIFDDALTKLFDLNQVEFKEKVDDFEITGTVDFIYDNCIYELKTISVYPSSPLLKHVMQVCAYSHLSGINKAKIIYVSLNDLPKVFDVDTSASNFCWSLICSRARTLLEALKNNIPPDKSNEDWECNNCEFIDLCREEK